MVGPSIFVALAATLLVYNHVQQRVTEIAFWLGLAPVSYTHLTLPTILRV